MYSFGERQAGSELQKWFFEYEISFRSAIVLHLTNRNSFGHTKHGRNDTFLCFNLAPPYHPLQIMDFAGLPYIRNTENIRTIKC